MTLHTYLAPFRRDNTEGYTDRDLAEMNSAFAALLPRFTEAVAGADDGQIAGWLTDWVCQVHQIGYTSADFVRRYEETWK